MDRSRQTTACWLARTTLLAGLTVAGLALTTAAHAQKDQAQSPGGAQSQPAKPTTSPAPADLAPPGGANRSAQQVGSKPPVESIEPGVNTSATQPSSSDTTPPPAPAAAATGSSAGADGHRLKGAGTTGGKAHDTIQLDTTQITGNRELPKVLYIVPWKRSDLGDLLGKPVNSLLDEVLTPVDRDVFKRQNRYYDALKPDAAKDAAGAAAGPQKP
jgi:hypothetical protein